MNNVEILKKIGLSEKESAIYLTLLEFGPSTISTIAKKTGIHRPLIYKELPDLQAHGIVRTMPKGKQTLYVAEGPEKLESLFEQLKVQFGELLPQLKSIHQSANKRPIVKYMEGKDGITSIFDDLVTSLKHGDIFYRYSSAKNVQEANNYLSTNYREKRDTKQLERFIITSEAQSKDKKPRLERDIRIVPKEFDLFDYDVTQIIYGDKVAFIDYNTETTLVIENPIIAEFQRKIFKLVYNGLV